jgi:hypothetical protein
MTTEQPPIVERLPPVKHARDCEYVTSDDPAPCTCDFYEREQQAIAKIGDKK